MLFPVVIVHIAETSIGFVAPGPLLSRPGEQQSSGIPGTVYRLAGNHMPAPNRPSHPSADTGAHPPAGVKATVCIFQLTSDTQVIRQGQSSPYYRAVLTRLIRQIETDDKGHFEVLLPPGTYSVFTKKDDLFYASRRDEKNHIAPVEVLPGKMTRVECSVESDHKVVY